MVYAARIRGSLNDWEAGPASASPTDQATTAQMIVEVLKRCGDDLSRENLLKQATNIQGLQLPLFLPSLKVNISPTSRIA